MWFSRDVYDVKGADMDHKNFDNQVFTGNKEYERS